MIRHWTQKLLKLIAMGLEKRKTHSIRDSREYSLHPSKKKKKKRRKRNGGKGEKNTLPIYDHVQ